MISSHQRHQLLVTAYVNSKICYTGKRFMHFCVTCKGMYFVLSMVSLLVTQIRFPTCPAPVLPWAKQRITRSVYPLPTSSIQEMTAYSHVGEGGRGVCAGFTPGPVSGHKGVHNCNWYPCPDTCLSLCCSWPPCLMLLHTTVLIRCLV